VITPFRHRQALRENILADENETKSNQTKSCPLGHVNVEGRRQVVMELPQQEHEKKSGNHTPPVPLFLLFSQLATKYDGLNIVGWEELEIGHVAQLEVQPLSHDAG
jgi:hypothetical protein